MSCGIPRDDTTMRGRRIPPLNANTATGDTLPEDVSNVLTADSIGITNIEIVPIDEAIFVPIDSPSSEKNSHITSMGFTAYVFTITKPTRGRRTVRTLYVTIDGRTVRTIAVTPRS